MYGPLKNENQVIEVTLDDYFCTENCDKTLCRFRGKNNVYTQKGTYQRPNLVTC